MSLPTLLAAALLLATTYTHAHAAPSFPPRDMATASFPHYPGRKVFALSGDWGFTFINGTFNSSNATSLPKDLPFASTQTVPSAWDSQWGTGLQYSRGAGYYRGKVQIPAGAPAALHFEACSIFCRVYIDGVLVANHTAGGYTPFWVDVPPSQKGEVERVVTVMASNVFDKELTPTQAAYYDFYQYGGIIREVTLHVLPTSSPSLHRVAVNTQQDNKKDKKPNGAVDVEVTFRGAANKVVSLALCWDLPASAPPCTGSTTAHANADGVASLPGLKVPGWKAWSPEQPNLHTLTVFILDTTNTAINTATNTNTNTGTNTNMDTGIITNTNTDTDTTAAAATDGIQVRFGLRIVSAEGRGILINGVRTKLHGYNRHDMYPQVGPSLTDAIYDADLKLLQGDLKGNFIRGSHYPQDPRFLDRCDEQGVMVWEETLAWGNYATVLTDPLFLGASIATANALVDRDVNHASIILWGFFNEGQSDNAAAKPAYKAMADTFKKRDPTRLVTWADNRGTKSLCYEYADVVSNNYYPGWYNGPASGINDVWSDRAAWVAANYASKPFIISETGAGGIVGQHSNNQTRWSEEYQVTVDGADAMVAMNNSNITGLALWQFCDIKVNQPNASTGRPGGINNKGVVSRWRDPKPAAKAVAAAYAKATAA